MSGPRLMLLDSASMYFRAFYGVPDRFTGRDGTPVNAVRGFLDAIARLLTGFRPDQLVACWDEDWRPAFRVDLIPTYKAHRVAGEPTDTPAEAGAAEDVPDELQVQEPVMVAVLHAIGIARVGAAGFEADDVIAHFARQHGGPVDVVSGDRDLFQLADDARQVRVIYTAKGMNNLQLVTDDWLRGKYGVPGSRYADLAILRGDASDGLPGVSGVGEKTAASLVQRFGHIDAILAAAQNDTIALNPGLRRRLLAAGDYLAAADTAVRLMHEVPVPRIDASLPVAPAHPQELLELVDAYQLDGPVGRVLAALESVRQSRTDE